MNEWIFLGWFIPVAIIITAADVVCYMLCPTPWRRSFWWFWMPGSGFVLFAMRGSAAHGGNSK